MARSVIQLALLLALAFSSSQAFLTRPGAPMKTMSNSATTAPSASSALRMVDDNEADRLRALGYTEEEIRRSRKESDPEELKVNVNLIPDVDPVTLTALGFGLIAFNFLVLGNLGDGGIGGIVATIINSTR